MSKEQDFEASHRKAALHSTTISDPYWFLLDVRLVTLVTILVLFYLSLIVVGAVFNLLITDPESELAYDRRL